jgi:hypothetical protein
MLVPEPDDESRGLPVAPLDIRTPYGIAPAEDPAAPDVQAQLRELCGEQALITAELSRALVEIDALRRRIAALEQQRAPYRRNGRALP